MNNVIRVVKRGSFHVGGERVRIEHAPVEDYPYNGKFTFHSDPNGTHWVKQMYVQYTILDEPKAPYPVLMWHGGGLTGVTWETTPDGREGWDTQFLRAGFDVYISDAVERGRAGWAKFPEINPTPPVFHTFEARWLNLKLGVNYPVPYAGSRFPTAYYDQLMMQGVPRWITSDAWTMEAYIKYLERMRQSVDGVVLLAHSQGAIFAMQAAGRFPDLVKALVLVEPVGISDREEDFAAIRHIPQLFIWGDYMSGEYEPVHSWVQSFRTSEAAWRACMDRLHTDYTWLSLPERGIRGNSHMLMMDDNNAEIAEMIFAWLSERSLGSK